MVVLSWVNPEQPRDLCGDMNVSPYLQVYSRSRSTSFQQVACGDHCRRRSFSPAAYSRPWVPGPWVVVHRSLALQSLTLVVKLCINSRLRWPPPTRPWFLQHPFGAAPQTTIFSVGSSSPNISLGRRPG